MLKKLLTDALDIVKNNRRLYFTLNGLYYGLIIVGLVYTQFDRSVQNTLMQGLNTTYGSGGPLSSVLDAYTNGKIVQAIAVTFGINLVVGSFASITLPSLIVPFLGLAVAIWRAYWAVCSCKVARRKALAAVLPMAVNSATSA